MCNFMKLLPANKLLTLETFQINIHYIVVNVRENKFITKYKWLCKRLDFKSVQGRELSETQIKLIAKSKHERDIH